MLVCVLNLNPTHSHTHTTEREFNIKKNHAALFLGVIDSHNYLLDVNDRGSYHAKGGQYLVVCTEDCLKVS